MQDIPSDRICRFCKLTKPLDEFVKHPTSKRGRTHKCKVCTNRDNNEYHRVMYATNAEWRAGLRAKAAKRLQQMSPEERIIHNARHNELRKIRDAQHRLDDPAKYEARLKYMRDYAKRRRDAKKSNHRNENHDEND